MNIAGLQKTTLLDYPGKIACTVFLPGCNLRCPFCHNASLVLPDRLQTIMTPDDLMAFLQTRIRKLDGVCITGGEPTLHYDLPELLRRIHSLGFSVKLDTNGSRPEMLRAILQEGLADYVAMDIKNAPEKYAETCGGIDILPQAAESIRLLMESGVDYEFRTTVVHPFHTPKDLAAIGRWITGAKRYFLQAFVDSGDLVGFGEAMTDAELQELLQAVTPFIPNTQLRGV